MKKLTDLQLKKIAKEMLNIKYGFSPTLSKITLLEPTEDKNSIAVKTGIKKYQINFETDKYGHHWLKSLNQIEEEY